MREEASRARAAIGAPSVAPVLLALQSRGRWVLRWLPPTLAKIGPPALDPLIGALDSEIPRVRAGAAESLAFMGPAAARAVSGLMKLLGRDPEDGKRAAWASARSGPIPSPLWKDLEGREPCPALRAIIALGRMGPDSEPTLVS